MPSKTEKGIAPPPVPRNSLFPQSYDICSTNFAVLLNSTDNISSESLEALRERLDTMKRLMADRPGGSKRGSESSREGLVYKATRSVGIIDGNFLSMALMGVLVVIISVSSYAFYSLYHAVLKKFPSRHTEL